MKVIAAVMVWASRQDDRAEWEGVRIFTEGGADIWPIGMAAACSLSGMLDDARSMADLEEAARHFATLVEIGVMGEDDVMGEIDQIMAEVDRVIGDDSDDDAFEQRRRAELEGVDDPDAVLAEVDAICDDADRLLEERQRASD